MEKHQIGVTQLVVLLFLSRQFTSLTYFPGIGNPVSGTAMLYGYGISAILLPLLFLPFILMAKRYSGCSIVMNLGSEFGHFGSFLGMLYYLYVLLLAAHTVSQFQFFMLNAVFPDASVWAIVLPLLAVSFYAAHIGVEGIARSGFLIFIGFLLAFGLIVFSSVSNVELKNIYPIGQDGWKEIATGSRNLLFRSTEPILFGLLLPYSGRKTERVAITFTLLSVGVLAISAFFILTVLGSFSYSQTFPFYSLASMSEISVFQRMDALYMGIWVFVGFVKLSLLLAVGKDVFPSLLPQRIHQRASRFSLPITGVLVLAIAIPACYQLELLHLLNRFVFNGVVVVLLEVLLPLLLLIKSSRRKEKQG